MNWSALRTDFAGDIQLLAQLADLIALQADMRVEMLFEDLFRRFGGDLFDLHAALCETISTGMARARSTTMPRYSSRAMSQPSSTSTCRTVCPAGPVWIVTSCCPAVLGDGCRFVRGPDQLDAVLIRCSATVPLPRPPAWICALTTATAPPNSS